MTARLTVAILIALLSVVACSSREDTTGPPPAVAGADGASSPSADGGSSLDAAEGGAPPAATAPDAGPPWQPANSSDLSTGPEDPYGALVVVPDVPALAGPDQCTGEACLALLNPCADAACHDVTLSCQGSACTLPVYVNASAAACLADVSAGTSLGCFAAGITRVDVHPSSTGSLLALRAQSSNAFLASLYLSSAPPAVVSAPPVVKTDALPSCSLPPGVTACDDAARSCALGEAVSLAGPSCRLDLPYALDLNGYSLQGAASANIVVTTALRNSANRGAMTIANVTLIAADATTTAIDLSQSLGMYAVTLQGVQVYGGAYGIRATDVNLEVDSCAFYHNLTAVDLTRSPSPTQTGQSVRVAGSLFSGNGVGVHVASNWDRDRYVSVWQFDKTTYQDPSYQAPMYPPNDDPGSNVGIYGNRFDHIAQVAVNLEHLNGAEVFANEIDQFEQVGLRAFKSFHPYFNSNDIHDDQLAHSTIGIDVEYSVKEGVVHNVVRAATAVATHSYGGQYRHTQGYYYNEFASYLGVLGVWDEVNSGTPQTASESWTDWMSDAEAAGNDFASYSAATPLVFATVATVANQNVASVPALYAAGQTASYPVYPYDRIHDPAAATACVGSSVDGGAPPRTWHIDKAAEQTVTCPGNVIKNSPFWIGNFYDARMADNFDRVGGASGPDGYFDVPVWTISAPTNACPDPAAAQQYQLGFASFGASDYMAKTAAIPYAGLCDLGPSTSSLATILPARQPSFPVSVTVAAGYAAYVSSVLTRTDGADTCAMDYRRAQFPVAACP